MKFTSFLPLYFFLSLSITCLFPSNINKEEWLKIYGTKNGEGAIKILPLTDGGFVVFGRTYAYFDQTRRGYLLKLANNGDLLWQKIFQNFYDEKNANLLELIDGTIIFFNGKGLCTKLDKEGNLLWQKRYNEFDNGQNIGGAIASPDGGYSIWGTALKNNDHFGVIGFDPNGNVLWKKIFTKPPEANLTSTEDGIIFRSQKFNSDQYITETSRVDSDGNIATFNYASPKQTSFYHLLKTQDGGMVIFDKLKNNYYELIMTKLDNKGKVTWQEKFIDKSPKRDIRYEIGATSDGGYLLNIPTWDNEGGRTKALKISKTGKLEWAIEFERSFSLPPHFLETTIKDFIIRYREKIIKIDEMGNILWEKELKNCDRIFHIFNNKNESFFISFYSISRNMCFLNTDENFNFSTPGVIENCETETVVRKTTNFVIIKLGKNNKILNQTSLTNAVTQFDLTVTDIPLGDPLYTPWDIKFEDKTDLFLGKKVTPKIHKIAVFPFATQTQNSQLQYFSQTLADSLSQSLSTIEGVTSIDKKSISKFFSNQPYPQTNSTEIKTLAERAKQTGADSLLLSTLSFSNNIGKITCSVINSSTGLTYQFGTFAVEKKVDKELELFGLMNDVVIQILPRIGMSISSEELSNLKDKKITNAIHLAYSFYTKGREEYNKFYEEGYLNAEKLFQSAISLNPNYSLAYAGLAETYSYLGFRFEPDKIKSQSYYDLSLENANKAIQISPNSAESHRAMAMAYRKGSKQNKELQAKEAKLAVDLNPNDAEAYFLLWDALGSQVDSPYIKKCLELNPELIVANNNLGFAYQMKKTYDKAIIYYKKALQSNPKLSYTHNNLGAIYLETKKFHQAFKHFKEAVHFDPSHANACFNAGNAAKQLGLNEGAGYYYKMACDLGHKDACEKLKLLGMTADAIKKYQPKYQFVIGYHYSVDVESESPTLQSRKRKYPDEVWLQLCLGSTTSALRPISFKPGSSSDYELLLRGPILPFVTNDNIPSLIFGSDIAYGNYPFKSNQTISVSLGGKDDSRFVVKNTTNSNPVVWLERNGKAQRIAYAYSRPMLDQLFLYWAGDLDKDGFTDFVLSRAGQGACIDFDLYLSAEANIGELVNKCAKGGKCYD